MEKERVAIVKVAEQRIDEALRELVVLLGGLERLIPARSRVMIKPNFTFAPTDRGITHPEVIEGVVRLVAETSPRKIVIAESSGDTYTPQAFRLQGIYRIAARHGARVVDLNLEEGVKTPVPDGLGRDDIMVPEAVVENDILISLPIFKLWGGNPLSLCLKNLFGLYGGRYYGYNKNSDSLAKEHPFYGLPGEIGTELGSHKPTPPQSICAMNAAVKTHLCIIDALEGGDGAGNWIRLDALIAGRNPVSTDAVGLAAAGFDAGEYDTFKLCNEHGLGPCRLDEIDVVGRPIEDISFPLTRLKGNVIEMPVEFCLNLLSADELRIIHNAYRLYGFLPEAARPSDERASLLRELAGILNTDGFFEKALSECNEHALALLDIIVEMGGTSSDVDTVRSAFCDRCGGPESLTYAPASRALIRLGLACVVEGACRSYYLLPEGVTEALKHIRKMDMKV